MYSRWEKDLTPWEKVKARAHCAEPHPPTPGGESADSVKMVAEEKRSRPMTTTAERTERKRSSDARSSSDTVGARTARCSSPGTSGVRTGSGRRNVKSSSDTGIGVRTGKDGLIDRFAQLKQQSDVAMEQTEKVWKDFQELEFPEEFGHALQKAFRDWDLVHRNLKQFEASLMEHDCDLGRAATQKVVGVARERMGAAPGQDQLIMNVSESEDPPPAYSEMKRSKKRRKRKQRATAYWHEVDRQRNVGGTQGRWRG